MKKRFVASAKQIQVHLDVLCRQIGRRIAASKNEIRAADYIAQYMKNLGLVNVTQHRFPFLEWGYEVSELRVKIDGTWRKVRCVPVACSPSTSEKGIEAEIVCVDSATPAAMRGLHVQGKILFVWGTYGETTERLEYLARSGVAAVLWLDDRLPFNWPAAVGTPYDWRDILPVPQVSISFIDAWRLAQRKNTRALLRTKVWKRDSFSMNVFGDLPGTSDEFVHVGGHMDTVIQGTGADDDASGVAGTLEIARVLTHIGKRPRRTVRFVAYGAEEHLSEGARQYVLAHRREAQHTRLCVNLDSIGSLAGRNEVRVVGTQKLANAVKAISDYPCDVKEEVSPYSDMFPLNVFGAPSVWFYRVNMPTGRFFHHSEWDTLSVVSAHQIARTASAAAALTYQAAFGEPPWKREIPKEQREKIRDYAKRFFSM